MKRHYHAMKTLLTAYEANLFQASCFLPLEKRQKMVEDFFNRKTPNAKTAILQKAIKHSGVLQLSNYLTIITPELSGSSSILNSSNSISIHEDGDGKRFLYREFLNKGLIPA